MKLLPHLTNSNILKNTVIVLFFTLLLSSCLNHNTEVKVPEYKTSKEDFENQFKEANEAKVSWSFKSGFINGELKSNQNMNLELYYAKNVSITENFVEEKMQLAQKISDKEILNKNVFDSFNVKIYKGDSLMVEKNHKITPTPQ